MVICLKRGQLAAGSLGEDKPRAHDPTPEGFCESRYAITYSLGLKITRRSSGELGGSDRLWIISCSHIITWAGDYEQILGRGWRVGSSKELIGQWRSSGNFEVVTNTELAVHLQHGHLTSMQTSWSVRTHTSRSVVSQSHAKHGTPTEINDTRLHDDHQESRCCETNIFT